MGRIGYKNNITSTLAFLLMRMFDGHHSGKFTMRTGGRDGLHGEALGHLLAEMQWLQRAYPGARW